MKAAYLLACILVAFALVMKSDTAPAQDQKNTGSPKTSNVEKKTGQSASDGAPVIGHLESRDRTITITKGPKGPLYTVKTKDGKIIAKKIDEKNLQAKYPDVYHQIKSGVAGNDAALR
jgi:hypothetical protein